MGPNVCSCNQIGIMNCHETKTTLKFFLLKCPYLDVFWRSASFLFHIKCGVGEANKKEGGGGSMLLKDSDGTSEWMSRIDNECKNLIEKYTIIYLVQSCIILTKMNMIVQSYK